jgi:hypothetical protein
MFIKQQQTMSTLPFTHSAMHMYDAVVLRSALVLSNPAVAGDRGWSLLWIPLTEMLFRYIIYWRRW